MVSKCHYEKIGSISFFCQTTCLASSSEAFLRFLSDFSPVRKN
jgi:hypothetical protein